MTVDTAPETKSLPEKERIPLKPFSSRRKLKETYRRKIEEARAEAGKDPMTGLPNKGAFDKRVKEEADRLKRIGGVTTVITLDADKLKDINDSQGHSAGNRYIMSIAEAIREGIRRDIDFAARTGGDEFTLILPGTNIEGAEKMWEEALNPEFIKRGIAISAGAAPLDPSNIQESIDRADSAMYGAKREPTRNGENMLFSYIRNGGSNG